MKRIVFSLMLLFALSTIIATSYAIDVSVSPAAVSVNNMLRGGFAQRVLKVRTFSETGIRVRVYLDPNYPVANKYLNFSPPLGIYNISRFNSLIFNITIRPSKTAENNNYTTYLRFDVQDINTTKGTTSLAIQTSVAAKISFQLTDQETKACRSFYEKVSNAEQGNPVYFSATIINDGNVEFAPKIRLDIYNKEQTQLVKTVIIDNNYVMPTLSEEIVAEIGTNDLTPGQYWLNYAIDECSSSGLLTFDVLKPGEVSTNGKLLFIKNKVWVKTNEEVPITIAFKNTGETAVNAKFVGQVKLNGKVLKKIETDLQLAEPSKTIYFRSSFTPKKTGIYDVTGKIYYGNKISNSYTSRINVIKGEEQGKNFEWIFGAIIILIVAIAIKKRKLKKKGHDKKPENKNKK